MKKIISICTLGLLVLACNKPNVKYGTTLPWTGLKPISAIIDGKSVLFTQAGYYAQAGMPALFGGTSTITSGTDSTYYRSISFKLPEGGGALNASLPINKTVTNYTMSYNEIFVKGTDTMYNKTYSSTNSDADSRFIMVKNDTVAQGAFYGQLRRTLGNNDYIDVSTGYFYIVK